MPACLILVCCWVFVTFTLWLAWVHEGEHPGDAFLLASFWPAILLWEVFVDTCERVAGGLRARREAKKKEKPTTF